VPLRLRKAIVQAEHCEGPRFQATMDVAAVYRKFETSHRQYFICCSPANRLTLTF